MMMQRNPQKSLILNFHNVLQGLPLFIGNQCYSYSVIRSFSLVLNGQLFLFIVGHRTGRCLFCVTAYIQAAISMPLGPTYRSSAWLIFFQGRFVVPLYLYTLGQTIVCCQGSRLVFWVSYGSLTLTQVVGPGLMPAISLGLATPNRRLNHFLSLCWRIEAEGGVLAPLFTKSAVTSGNISIIILNSVHAHAPTFGRPRKCHSYLTAQVSQEESGKWSDMAATGCLDYIYVLRWRCQPCSDTLYAAMLRWLICMHVDMYAHLCISLKSFYGVILYLKCCDSYWCD